MRRIDCAHSRTLKTLHWPWFREGIGALKRKSNIFGFLWENHRFLGFSRRGIVCAYSRSVEMLPWPWFREISTGWAKKVDFCDFWDTKIYFSKDNFMFLGVILCGESIARIPEPWKCFPGPDSEKKLGFWKSILSMKLSQKYDSKGEISKFFDFRFNIHIYFPESGSRKHFHASRMRAIDSSPRKT